MRNSGGAAKMTRWLHIIWLSNEQQTLLCDYWPWMELNFSTSIQQKYCSNLQGNPRNSRYGDQIYWRSNYAFTNPG